MKKHNNLRFIAWQIDCKLDEEELPIVESVASTVLDVLKGKGLSHYQAVQVLELAKVLLGEEVIYCNSECCTDPSQKIEPLM